MNGTGASVALGDPVVVPRAAHRLKVFRQIWLETKAGRFRAHVLNLSPIGACLHARCEHRVWSGVVLSGGDTAADGRVVWTHGDVFGVKFVTPLSEAEVQDLAGC